MRNAFRICNFQEILAHGPRISKMSGSRRRRIVTTLAREMPAAQRIRALAAHLGTAAADPSPPAPPGAAAVGTVGSGMVVASVEAKHVLRAGGTCLVFVKIVTDSGVVGWGEATNSGRNLATAEAVMEAARHLEGKDPFEIERHWQQIYRGTFRRGGPILCSALAGIEMALWDIKGKSLGVPVYELLGGKVREKVRCYAHCGAPGAPHLDPYTPPEERRAFLETFDAKEWCGNETPVFVSFSQFKTQWFTKTGSGPQTSQKSQEHFFLQGEGIERHSQRCERDPPARLALLGLQGEHHRRYGDGRTPHRLPACHRDVCGYPRRDWTQCGECAVVVRCMRYAVCAVVVRSVRSSSAQCSAQCAHAACGMTSIG